MQDEYQVYQKFFGKSPPEYHILAPYRACPIGAHSDHQHGLVLGLAFDRGITILASSTENGKIELISLSFEGVVGFNTLQPIQESQNDWGDYIRGAVFSLKRNFVLKKGVKGVIKGTMPVGGLSSSAALLCGFLSIILKANQIQLSDQDIINYSSYAEREYIGLRNGILDQSCVMLSKLNRLLYLDTKTQKYQLLRFGEQKYQQNNKLKQNDNDELPFEIGIFFSGVTRKLTETNFNMKVAECKVTAWMLKGHEGQNIGELEDARLRDIDESIFLKHKDKIPLNFLKRTTHFYEEFNRVKRGVQAWKKGDIKEFGKIMFQSCESSAVNYEVASPQLMTIYEIMKETDGIYGGRFCGAGFKGACVAIVDPTKKKQIEQKMVREYLKKLPQYKDSFQVFFCKSDDGLRFIKCKEARKQQ